VDQDGALALVGAIGHSIIYTRPGIGAIQLWRSDGPPSGTIHLADVAAVNAQSAVAISGQLYFSASTSAHGEEPWVTDGSIAGPHLVSDLVAGPDGSQAQNYVVIGEAVYFRALPSPPARLRLRRIESCDQQCSVHRRPASYMPRLGSSQARSCSTSTRTTTTTNCGPPMERLPAREWWPISTVVR
jgi:ELWxxDGT repeat protein